jgi:phosphate transport system permease protein
LLIATIALLVSVPVGLSPQSFWPNMQPRCAHGCEALLEILAGIPTVVYGFFAAMTVGPLLRTVGESFGLTVASESALSAGLVMGVMIIPFVSSLAGDMIAAGPQSLRDGAYALGATRSETIRNVVLPAALPGIVGGVLLAAFPRQIGETMIVVMAAGLSANLTANPFEGPSRRSPCKSPHSWSAIPNLIARRRWPRSRLGLCCSSRRSVSTSLH